MKPTETTEQQRQDAYNTGKAAGSRKGGSAFDCPKAGPIDVQLAWIDGFCQGVKEIQRKR